jgi:hypothetical protein
MVAIVTNPDRSLPFSSLNIYSSFIFLQRKLLGSSNAEEGFLLFKMSQKFRGYGCQIMILLDWQWQELLETSALKIMD